MNPAKKTRPALFLGSILIALPVLAASAHAQVSLATVVDLAQKNSSQVLLADADVRKASAALAESRDPLWPSLVAGSGLPAFPSKGYTGGVPALFTANVQSLVFSMPQMQYIAAARSGLKAARLSLKDAREQSALDAATAYLEMDSLDRQMEAVRLQEGYANRLVEITQQRAEAGVDPLMELFQARLTAAQIKLSRLHLESRQAVIAKQLSVLTGLPTGSILVDRASIPEIPGINADTAPRRLPGLEASQMLATAKQKTASGDSMTILIPQVAFNLQYLRTTTMLNDVNSYFSKALPVNNIASGFSVQIPFFDWGHRDKARESSADALRARVEAEQAQRQSEVQVATLTASLHEMDTLAEIASLKQQIANQQIAAITAQLENGNGSAPGPGATPQISPRAEQLARIDERQKYQEALEASFDLSRTRLNLLRALGHMEDWLNELHASAK